MGSRLSTMWKEADVVMGSEGNQEKPLRCRQLERTAVYLSQDPRSPPKQGTDVDRTPIQVHGVSSEAGENKENNSDATPVTAKATTTPLFDPRSPGIERSPIVVTAEDGTPVVKTKKDKSSFKNRLIALQRKE